MQPEDVPTEQVLQENKKVNMKTLLHKAEALDLKKLKATADKTADKTSGMFYIAFNAQSYSIICQYPYTMPSIMTRKDRHVESTAFRLQCSSTLSFIRT